MSTIFVDDDYVVGADQVLNLTLPNDWTAAGGAFDIESPALLTVLGSVIIQAAGADVAASAIRVDSPGGGLHIGAGGSVSLSVTGNGSPDQAGLDNWVGMLASGQDTRAQVVTGFSESQEDVNDLAPSVQQGLWVADAAAGEVARLYDTVLGRLPDGSGLSNWTHSLETGASLQSVADGFVGSQEFQTVYGALDDRDFVTLLYNNVLHRPRPGGPGQLGRHAGLRPGHPGPGGGRLLRKPRAHRQPRAPHRRRGVARGVEVGAAPRKDPAFTAGSAFLVK